MSAYTVDVDSLTAAFPDAIALPALLTEFAVWLGTVPCGGLGSFESLRGETLDGSYLDHDDATLLLFRANGSNPSVANNVMAPFRLLGGVRDNCQQGADHLWRRDEPRTGGVRRRPGDTGG